MDGRILGAYCENCGKVLNKYYKGQTYDLKIEATLNSHPLTQISGDLNDFNVLTPNHFNLGKQPLYFSPYTIKDDQVTNRTRWKAVQELTKMFWRRQIRGYLTTLQIRKK